MLIKLEKISKLLECICYSGFLKNEIPISAFLIAKPESGKSELIFKLTKFLNCYYINDLSYKGLIDYLLPDIENFKKSHILIPDFINILSHKRASESLIPVLNSLMAEGLTEIKFWGTKKEYKEPLHCGIITGITKEIFDKRIIFWRHIGFLTRMLVITYSYSETTKNEIHKAISQGNNSYEKDKKNENFENYKLKSFDVKIPDNISKQIEILSVTTASNNAIYTLTGRNDYSNWKITLSTYGFRLHKILRCLIKSICLYNSNFQRTEVNEDDFKDLMSFMEFINFNFNEI